MPWLGWRELPKPRFKRQQRKFAANEARCVTPEMEMSKNPAVQTGLAEPFDVSIYLPAETVQEETTHDNESLCYPVHQRTGTRAS